jgi:hypothetical protein
MTNTQFLWLIFGGWALLFVIAALTLFRMRVGRSSFVLPMVAVGVSTGAATAAKTGSILWGLAFAAFALVSGVVLERISPRSARTTSSAKS